MTDNDDRKWLYERMQKAGVNTGSYDDFTASMNNKEDRDWYYQKSIELGLNVGSADEFTGMMADKPSTPAQPATPAQQEEHSPYQMAQGNTPTYNYGGQMPSAPRPATPRSKGNAQPTQTAAAQPLGPEKFAKQMQFEQRVRQSVPSPEAMMQDFSQRMENIRKGNQPFGSASEQRYNPETGKMGTVYFTKSGEEVSTPMEQQRINREVSDPVGSELREAYAERDRLNKEIDRRTREVDKANEPSFAQMLAASEGGGYNPVFAARSEDPELSMLWTAKRKNEARIKTLEREGKNEGFFRTLGKTLFSLDTWDFGLFDLIDAGNMMAYGDKKLKGSLGEAKESMMENTYRANVAQQQYGENDTFWQRAGEITGNAIPFVAEFALTGGYSGLTQAGTKAGSKMAAKYATGKVGQWVIKNTGTLVGDMAAGFAMANTTGGMKTAADIINRHQGQLVKDEDGDYVFDGGKSWGRSIYEGEMANTLEYFTEKLGVHLDGAGKVVGGWLGKGMERMGAGRASELFNRITGSEWAKITGQVLRKGGVQDYPSEVVEEEANILLNSLLVGDNKFSDFVDGKTQADIWGGMMLSIGFMQSPGMVGGGYQTAQYYRYKHKTDMSDRVAFTRLTPERWEPWRERIDNTTNEDMRDVISDIIGSQELQDEEKKAAINYVGNLMQMRGYNLRTTADAKDKINGTEAVDEAVDADNESYQNGYEADEQSRRDIAIEYSMNPDDEVRAAAVDGVRQRIEDDADMEVEGWREEGRKMMHSDGSIRPAVLKVKNENGDDTEVYIVEGNVQMMADGTMVDPETSDRSVVIYDPATGERKMIDPTSDMGILSIGEATSAEDFDYEIQRRRDEYVQRMLDEAQGTVRVELGQQLTMPDGKPGVVMAISPDGESFTVVANDGSGEVRMERSDLQQVADAAALADYQARHQEEAAEQPTEEATGEQAAVAPGIVEGAPSEFLPDIEITILDDDGKEKPATVISRVRYEGGQFVPDETGNIVEYVVDGQVKHENTAMLAEKVVSYVDATLAAQETAAEQPAAVKQPTVETPTAEVETPATEPAGETTGTVAEQPTVEPMPMREDGEADFLATTPERGHQFIYNEAGLSREEAGQFVKANLETATKALDKAKKEAPKMGTSLVKYKQQQAEHQAKVDAAQQAVDYWQGVKATQSAIVSAEMAEQAERDRAAHEAAVLAEQKRQAEELAKQQEQAERGANAVHPAIREKWDGAPKVEGAENEITLANGETLNGRYMLVESGAATPSHNATSGFARSEGFPVDENGQTVNDRDYERDQQAQQITRDMADQYDSRAIQNVPVVSRDGVVLSGNGRTMAGELAAQNGTDGAYIEHLRKYPQQFGFTPEQVEGMQHPRVVFVPDEAMPYTTETFAKFNQQDMKSQSRTEQSVKMGKTVDDATFGRIVRSINAFDTLGDFYNDPKAAPAAIGELHKAGAINQMQVAEMMDGEKVSGQGRQMLENLLIGKSFEGNPDAVRQLAEFPAMRQSVVSALAEIANNIHLGEDYSLESEMAQAINLAYQARKSGGIGAGEKVSGFARQQSLFPFDEGETVADYTNATVLMLADCLNDGRVSQMKKVLAIYNDHAAQSAAGQYDIFSGGVKIKEEIINDVLNILNNGTETEQQTALTGAAERRKEAAGVGQDGVAGNSDAGSGAELANSRGLVEQEAGLSEDEADDLILASAARAKIMPQLPVPLTSVAWQMEFGNGVLQTPMGEVKLGENQFAKMITKGREKEAGMIKPTLTDPDFIIEEASQAGDGNTERSSSYLFVKAFIGNDGKKRYFFKSVTVKKDGLEINISNHIDSAKRLREALKKGKLLYRFDGGAQTEQTPASASVTTSPVDLQGVSERKDTNNSETEQEKVVSAIKSAEAEVDTNPTKGQKKAGNYKMGHVKVDGYDITIENPKGSVRRGTDPSGKAWEQEMHNTYGYIRGTEGVDGDHIDVFLSDDPTSGDVFVVDQVDQMGIFDEHKVMYGFPDIESAKAAYLSNYEEGWQGCGAITPVSKEEFKKWIESSHRKTKPFAEYASVKTNGDTQLGEGSPYARYQREAEDEIQQLLDAAPDRTGSVASPERTEAIQKIADMLNEADSAIEDLELNDDQKQRFQARRDAAEKWLEENVYGEGVALSVEDLKEASDEAEGAAPAEQPQAEATEETAAQPKAETKKSKCVDDEDAERFEELRRRMRELNGHLNMGVNPEQLAIGVEMSYYVIKHGAHKFADYAKQMIDALGEWVRPYLKSFYNGARDLPEMEVIGDELTPYDEVKTFDVMNFDKEGPKDIIAMADEVVKEQDVEKQKEEAEKKLIDKRKERWQRKKKAEKPTTGDKDTTKKPKNGKKDVSLQSQMSLFDSEGTETEPKGTESRPNNTESEQPTVEEEQDAESTLKYSGEQMRKMSAAVTTDLLIGLQDGVKPYKSIVDLRRRAKSLGLEVDDEGRDDVALQEMVEDGLVRAARTIIESGNYGGSKSREAYNAICKLYDMQPTISRRSANRVKMQQYSTPLPMAFMADSFAWKPGMKKILEPTAGNGMLVFAVPAKSVIANELDETRLANLKEQGFLGVIHNDALTHDFRELGRYDAVIANPPFGSAAAKEYDGKSIAGLDEQITLNALAAMKDDGRAAIIIGGNMEYAKNCAVSNNKAFWTYLYDHYNVKGVVDMDGKLYAKQGTTYPTRMILIDGRRSEDERAQSTVYPPRKFEAVRMAETFEDLYDIINEINQSKNRTNGNEVLRTSSKPIVSNTDNETGRTNESDTGRESNENVGNGSQREPRPTNSGRGERGDRQTEPQRVPETPRESDSGAGQPGNAGVSATQTDNVGRAAGSSERSGSERTGDTGRVHDDGVKMSKLRGYSKKRYDNMLERAEDSFKKQVMQTAERMNIGDQVQVVATADEITDEKLTEKQKSDKALYSPTSDKIYIILGNHRNMDDVMKSLLHESVAHHGLRELFGDHFDTFLDNVYAGSEESIREKIASMAAKHGWNVRTATEEYLAQMAETMDFEKPENNSWWSKVKTWFFDMLHKIGFTVKNWPGTITDNELAYVLWRSYQNMVNPGRYRSPIEIAEDTVMQDKLSVGQFEKNADRSGSSNSEVLRAAEENGLLSRDGEDVPKVHAREAYERAMGNAFVQAGEAMQDSMMGLKQAYKAILKAEGNKRVNIEDAKGYENAYLAENRMSSMNASQTFAWVQEYMDPLTEEIGKITGKGLRFSKAKYGELTDYMMAKHGLERNFVMAKRDAQRAALEGKDYDEELQKNRERDYAGLTALTGESDVAAAEDKARQMVSNFEAEHDTTELWKAVNRATKSSLLTIAEAGFLTPDKHKEIRDMYEFYIPLQGFDEETADEAYDYLNHYGTGGTGSPIKKAEGRKSKADDPVATILANGEAAIRMANRNIMKQHFLRFVEEHPSDLVSVSDVWLKYNDITGEWEQYFEAELKEEDSPDEVARKVEAFEQKMEQLTASDPDHYKRGRDLPNVPYRVVNTRDLSQHQVRVMKGGQTVVMTINGNPRAAQALNGLTNPDINTDNFYGKVLDVMQDAVRKLSVLYTSANPDFVVSNFFRDAIYANTMVWVKETPSYAWKFNRNFGLVKPATMAKLFYEWQKGSLRGKVLNGTASEEEKMFYDFMWFGGETGWTSYHDIEEEKKILAKAVKSKGTTSEKAWKALHGTLGLANRSVENCARFAAFQTSRQLGRSLERAIWDAKEVSVNFNKKGASDRFMTAKNQKFPAQVIAGISGAGRGLFAFWNASIQGLYGNFVKNIVRHPVKGAALMGLLYGLGRLMPWVVEAVTGGGGDDDDDKNAYYNLPEYKRRSNICFRFTKYMPWITIPIPIEYRSFYGLGELHAAMERGVERKTTEELTREHMALFSQLQPLDFMEGGGGWHALYPTPLKPYIEAKDNESWTGLPIYRENKYGQYDKGGKPQWQRAFANADRKLVFMTRWLNESTVSEEDAKLAGGNKENLQGWIDWNPAKIEYMLKGYISGPYTFLSNTVKSFETVAGKRDFEWRNVPLLNRLVYEGDERTEARAISNEYFRLLDEYNATSHKLKEYAGSEEAKSEDPLALAERIAFLNSNKAYLHYLVIHSYKPVLDKYYELKKEAEGEEKKVLEAEGDALRKELVDLIHAIDEGQMESVDAIDASIEENLIRILNAGTGSGEENATTIYNAAQRGLDKHDKLVQERGIKE